MPRSMAAATVTVLGAMIGGACRGRDSSPGVPAAANAKLEVGSPAPSLAIGKWLRGPPVTGFEKDKVYVVEFWATWCAPCVASIAHLTALQHRYGENGLVIIGVTKGDEENTLEMCERMVANRGQGMDYRVAFDDEGRTYSAYMDAAGENGIPTSFVVDRTGKIAFIGHPTDLGLVVSGVLEGTWDPAKDAAARKNASEMLDLVRDSIETDAKAAMEKWNELERRWPDYAAQFHEVKFLAQRASGDAEGAARTAEGILEDAKVATDFVNLHIFAWRVAVQAPEGVRPDLDLALRLATEAASLCREKDGEVLRTLVKVRLLRGEEAKANALYDDAIRVSEGYLREALTKDREEFFAGGGG